MKQKFLSGLVWLSVAVIAAVAIVVAVNVLTGPSTLPSGVYTSVKPVQPAPSTTKTRTTTPPRPPTSTTFSRPPDVKTMTVPTTPAPPPAPVGCVQDGVSTAGWNTEADTSGNIVPGAVGPLAPPTASTGDCFDKLVFTVQTGADVEFYAQYVPIVTADGSGLPVDGIKGSKFIQLSIKAAMLRDEQNNPLYNPADYNIPDAQGFGNLRELRLVTPDNEKYVTFGIGVDTKTPFAVESYRVGEGVTNVVLYITRPHR